MTKLICLECGSVLESKYFGHFNTCGCPNEAFIDETKHYCRIGAVDLTKIKGEAMSLPTEKYRSLIYARNFLRDLLDPKKTPRVPKAIRREAYYRLKHYLTDHEIELLSKARPDILKKDEK